MRSPTSSRHRRSPATRPGCGDVRAFRRFQLSDEVERLLLEKQVAGRAAWMRLFDETMAALRFSVRGEALGSAEALNLLSDKDREVRKEAAQALGTVLGENVRTFALITNTLAKDKEIEDQWRGFGAADLPRAISATGSRTRWWTH